jgi:hypothetical protein
MPDRTGPIIVRSGRGPYAVSIALGLLLASTYGIIVSFPSSNVDDALNHQLALIWSIIGVTASLLVLVGLYMSNQLAGMVVERIGQTLIFTGASAYVAVLCVESTFGQSGLVVMTACSISVASLIRVVQITIDLRRQGKGVAQ